MILSIENIVTLQNVKGIGAGTIQKICAEAEPLAGGSLSAPELYDFVGHLIEDRRVTRVTLPDFEDFDRARSSAMRILETSAAMGINAVSRYDETFPKMLGTTVDEMTGRPSVPMLIYYKGDLSVTDRPALAVIGTREPTEKGFTAGQYYAEAFASIGVNIVSGLAVGCDTAGHMGALQAGGVTTAFLAHGLDMVYPQENERLAADIVANGGLLMSEYPIGMGVNRYNLVARDRLQAGLSNATLVVQTGVKGGTMHAVNATLQAGKPLFVVTYKDDQGEKEQGNRFLVSQKGAVGLRISRQDITDDPDRYRAMIMGKPADSPDGTTDEQFNPTLFQ